jgi:phage terminase large subunit-like protein
LLSSLSEEKRLALRADIHAGRVELSDLDAAILASTWEFWARPNQLEPPGDWTYWLILAGRGFGKTRSGGEWLRKRAVSGLFREINLIAATADDARDIMVEGESGLLAICPPWEKPLYRKSLRRLDWPNGCKSLIFTADEPERLRGKQHESLWADELAAWRYPEAWDQAMLGLRIGPSPRAVVTTTPRPTKLVRDLIADPACVVVAGSTYENRANLAPQFYDTIIRKYEGTRLGRQELMAELLEDVPGALWTYAMLDATRVQTYPPLDRVVVGVDPMAVADEETGLSETGVVCAGFNTFEQHGYVIGDYSVRGGPAEWAAKVVHAYHTLEADMVVAEINNGGDMVKHTIHTVDRTVPVKVVHASRGKRTRAEPVSMLYEQRRVHHVGGFPDLETQMTTWAPDTGEPSPDRMDALVWALTELMVAGAGDMRVKRSSHGREPVIRRGDLTLVGDRYIDKDR